MSNISIKERLFLEIIRTQYSASLIARLRYGVDYDRCFIDQVIFDLSSDSPKVGDIVLCLTSGYHEATVGKVKQIIDNSTILIIPLGENMEEKPVRVYNDMFSVIRGLPNHFWWEERHFVFDAKIKKAIYKNCRKLYLSYRGVIFEDNVAKLKIAKRFEDDIKLIEIIFNNKTTIKHVAEKIKEVFE